MKHDPVYFRPPIITSSINCQYNIEWWTEAACPIDTITSTSCGLNAQDHGIELDLTPLTKPSGQFCKFVFSCLFLCRILQNQRDP